MPPVREWGLMASCCRGTGVAIYDYADRGETLLGLPPPYIFCVVCPEPAPLDKFRRRFGADKVVSLKDWPADPAAVDEIIGPYSLSHVYFHKYGTWDNVVSEQAANLVHAVFSATEPHGARYAKIGPQVPGGFPIVPYMVPSWPKLGDDLRGALEIPADKAVLCRYGGRDSFNIKYALSAVVDSAEKRPDLTFLFANTDKWFPGDKERIIFLPSLDTDEEKASFVRTCDAMIHARSDGETFGLAIAEFAVLGRRVITERVSPDALHVKELGERGIYYHDYQSALKALMDFDRSAKLDPAWKGYAEYTPDKVMETFKTVFLS